MKLPKLVQALLLSCSLLAPSAALGDEAGDVVFLKGGGRVRGLVVEESPTAGVRVKLLDGTIKVVLAKDVDHVEYASAKPAEAPPAPEPKLAPKPEPPAPVAPLHIESEEPGIVSIDGAEVGPAPVDMKDIEPGKHRIRITYDRGGKSEKMVFVREGEPNDVRFEKSSATKAGEARAGVHLAFSGEPLFGYMPAVDGPVGGVRLFAGINLGLSPAVDLRAGGQIGFWGNTLLGLLPIQGRATFRFNLGPLYSMEVGGHAGVTFLPTNDNPDHPALAGGGPDFSVLSFRFGGVRQFEITAMESFDFLTEPGDDPGRYSMSFQQSVGFAWVLSD